MLEPIFFSWGNAMSDVRCTQDRVVIGSDILTMVHALAKGTDREVCGGFIMKDCGRSVAEMIIRTDLSRESVNNYLTHEVVFHTHPHVNSPSSQDLWMSIVRNSLAPRSYKHSLVFDRVGVYRVSVDPARVDVTRARAWLQAARTRWKKTKPQRDSFCRIVNRGLGALGLTVAYQPWASVEKRGIVLTGISLLRGTACETCRFTPDVLTPRVVAFAKL
jgi:hypothetical protein